MKKLNPLYWIRRARLAWLRYQADFHFYRWVKRKNYKDLAAYLDYSDTANKLSGEPWRDVKAVTKI